MEVVHDDLEDGTVVMTRKDMTVVVKSAAGKTTVTEHVDGTRISNIEAGDDDAEPSSVVIECGPDFAHVQQFPGSREAVVSLATGTSVSQLTPITAKPSGKQSGKEKKTTTTYSFLLTKAHGPSLFIRSDGTVRYIPSTTTPSMSIQEIKDNLAATDIEGVYCIDYKECSISVKDVKGNHFTVGNGRVTVSQEEVNAEQTAPAPRRHPLIDELIPGRESSYTMSRSPRLFLVGADGSGIELCRDHDIEHYLASLADDETTEIIMSSMPSWTSAVCISVIQNASTVEDNPSNRRFLSKAVVEDTFYVSQKNPPTKYDVYRSLVRYQPAASHAQQAVEMALQDAEARRKELELVSDAYILQDVRSKEEQDAALEMQRRVADVLAAHDSVTVKHAPQMRFAQKSESQSLAEHIASDTTISEEERLPSPPTSSAVQTGTFKTVSKILKSVGVCISGTEPQPTLPSGAPVIARPRTAEASRLCTLARKQSMSSSQRKKSIKSNHGAAEMAERSEAQQHPLSASLRPRSTRSRLVRTPQGSAEGSRSKPAAEDYITMATEEVNIDEGLINWDDIREELVPEDTRTAEAGTELDHSFSLPLGPPKRESGVARPVAITTDVSCVDFKNVIDGMSYHRTLKINNQHPYEKIVLRIEVLRSPANDLQQHRYVFGTSVEKLTLQPRETADLTVSLLQGNGTDVACGNHQHQKAEERRMDKTTTSVEMYQVLQLRTVHEVVDVDLRATIHSCRKNRSEKLIVSTDLPHVLAISDRKQEQAFAR